MTRLDPGAVRYFSPELVAWLMQRRDPAGGSPELGSFPNLAMGVERALEHWPTPTSSHYPRLLASTVPTGACLPSTVPTGACLPSIKPSWLSERSDAYGAMLLASLEGQPVAEIVERDDGFIAASRFGTALYLAPFRRWPPHHRAGMRYARGRVLDVGSGAGRVALHLQERGQEVIAIDNSPGAIEACRRRGVRDARLLSIDEVDGSLGLFDTIVMYGNNFGLFANARKAKRLLRRFHRLTSARGRIVAESRDVHLADDPIHLAYQERNRRRGRMAGQIRLRVRYRELATPWLDYLMVSQGELADLLNDTGWSIGHVFESEDTYVAVIEKTSHARHR